MDEHVNRKKLEEAFDNADPDVCESYPDGYSVWGFGRKNVRDVIRSVPSPTLPRLCTVKTVSTHTRASEDWCADMVSAQTASCGRISSVRMAWRVITDCDESDHACGIDG